MTLDQSGSRCPQRDLMIRAERAIQWNGGWWRHAEIRRLSSKLARSARLFSIHVEDNVSHLAVTRARVHSASPV
jgi:hypothetical protein